MTAFMIARLPHHPKSLEAVEFMQKNNFFIRISTNVPLMDILMTSGVGESRRLAIAMGLSEDFELGKEEIHVIDDLCVIKKEEDDVPESGQPGDQNHRLEMFSDVVKTEESVEVPMAAPNITSESVVMEAGKAENENFPEIHGDLPLPVVEQRVQRVLAETVFEDVQMEAEEREESNFLVERDEHRYEHRMEDEEESDMMMDEPSEATNPDVSMIPQPLPYDNDDFPVDDVTHDLQMRDETETVDHSKGGYEEINDAEKMEEFEEDELIEEQEDEEKEQPDQSSDGDDKRDEYSNEEKESSDDEDEISDEEREESDVEQNVLKKRRSRPSGNSVARLLFVCPFKKCPSNYKKYEELQEHMKIHPDKQDFFCDVCKKTFSSKEEAIAHIQEKKKKECCGCGKKFPRCFPFVLHLRCHTGEKPFVCKICGQRFARSTTLTRHLLAHTGEKRFSCRLCKKSFARKQHLESHERVHTGEKPFKCNQCDYRCARRSSLKLHNLVHTGEQPFECSECGRRFSQRSSLNAHIRIHSGQKPYSCKNCDMKFTQSGTLT